MFMSVLGIYQILMSMPLPELKPGAAASSSPATPPPRATSPSIVEHEDGEAKEEL
jgi:hypothetical protein